MYTPLIDAIRNFVADRHKNVKILFSPGQRDSLVENFGPPDSAGRYHRPRSQLQANLEETRHKHLLTQFDDYLRQVPTGLGLKKVCKKALGGGFTEAYRAGRFFADIAEAKVRGESTADVRKGIHR